MSSDASVAFDELLSLFTDDYEEDVELTSSSSSELPFAFAQPLSADEIDNLLRAIDNDGGEQSPSPPAQTQPRPQRKTSVKASVPKRKRVAVSSNASNKVRDGRKEEIMYLRKTVSELETRLSVVKSNNNRSAPASSSSSLFLSQEPSSIYNSGSRRIASRLLLADSSEGGDRDAKLTDVWREVARRQCDQREVSERENIRLRVVLESQIKVAKSLEKFLMLKAAASSIEIGKSVDLQRCDQLAYSSGLSERERDAAVFQNLLDGVEQSLAEVDAVYEANGLARMEKTQISAQTRFDPLTGMRVEVCASKVLPFGVHETGKAVWNHYIFAKERMPSRFYSYYSRKSIDATEDTVVEDFSLELHAKNTRGSFRFRKVTRRVIEEDRVVIVWRTFSDPIEFSEQQLSGLRSFEKGYIVVRKSSAGATLLQPCHIMYPCFKLDSDAVMTNALEDTVVGAITDFRLSATAEFVAGTHQMIENVLLEQALKSSNNSNIDLVVAD